MAKKTKNGDMPIEQFRQFGHVFVDWIADYLDNIDSFPVLSQVKPGEIKKSLPGKPPETGEKIDDIIDDINKIIIPGITHWNHPNFMGYFNSTSSGPGILAEFLSAAFNVNGMNWKSSPAAAELEETTLNWLRQMLGLQKKYWGIIYDTASVSTMHAIASAREVLPLLNVRQKGMLGRKNFKRLKLYTSQQAHSSIDKGAILLGIGVEGIRKIPVDKNFRMIPSELQKAINEDRENGWLPFCVIATIGTTSTTSIDPVNKIAKICKREELWLHVDAAHGGTAAIVPEMKYIFNGINQADSIVVNPHKWMFMPIDISVFFTRKPEVLRNAFSLVPEYLKTAEDSNVINYMDYGIQLGRRFRALKLWFVIRYFGRNGLIERIREHIRLGKLFASWIDENPNFERMAPVPFSTTCFRAVPQNISDENKLDLFNEKLMNNINKTGKIFLTHTKLNKKFVIRFVVSGIRTKEIHVIKAWNLIKNEFEKLIQTN